MKALCKWTKIRYKNTYKRDVCFVTISARLTCCMSFVIIPNGNPTSDWLRSCWNTCSLPIMFMRARNRICIGLYSSKESITAIQVSDRSMRLMWNWNNRSQPMASHIKQVVSYFYLVCRSWDFSRFLNVQCCLSEIKYPRWAKKWINLKKIYGNFYGVSPRFCCLNARVNWRDFRLSCFCWHSRWI